MFLDARGGLVIVDEKRKYNYAMVRVVCEGKISSCEFCSDKLNTKELRYDGFCSKCGRPLDKNPGDACSFIIGYVDRRYRQQDKVHIICRYCKTIKTI
jgi:hypothetical protein